METPIITKIKNVEKAYNSCTDPVRRVELLALLKKLENDLRQQGKKKH